MISDDTINSFEKQAFKKARDEEMRLAKVNRKEAEYWERVADLAKQDGDKEYAQKAQWKAAEFRQKAREIEARHRPF